MADQDDPLQGQDAQAVETPAEQSHASQTHVYAGAPVQFNDSIVIHPDQPLPELNRGPVQAFAARGSGRAPEQIYAMICDPLYASRSSKAPSYATLAHPSLQKLVSTGPTYWPPTGEERYVFIYQHNPATPLVDNNTKSVCLGWKPEQVTQSVIRPLVEAMIDLRNKDIIHGAIHPANIYINKNGKVIENVMLGDCLSLPGGYDMPVLYETIERGMAHPVGRGVGTYTDEMYSFGVTLASIVRTHDPIAHLDDRDKVRHKIEHGSFGSLISRDRLGGSILELLRGLLYDSPTQRWDLDDVEAWLEGERLTPKSAGKKIKASRPLTIGSKKYILPELIAREGGDKPKALADTIENGEMQQWLDRAIEDKGLKERFQQAYTLAQERGRNTDYPERLATRISIALHPSAPIRYKELCLFPDGVGKSLTEAAQKGESLQSYIDFIQDFFVTQWLDMHGATGVDNNSILNRFVGCRKYLQQKMLSFGIERCVYYLSEETHCLSEKLRGYFVRNAEDMIRAFEKISQNPKRPTYFFDRHSVAFLSVKDKQVVDRYVHELQSKEKFQLVLGELKVLESIQRTFRMEKFPGIGAWIADNMNPIYERIHNREVREEIKEKIRKEAENGSLTKMLALFENEKIFRNDFATYRHAMNQYLLLHQESEQLKESIERDKNFGKAAGRMAAAITSCIIATIVILLTVVMDI